nr:hypothetical protein [Polyangiaceae bacterium]
VSGGGGLYPTMNPQPWTCYVWEATQNPVGSISETSARATFRGALVEIEDFARSHESPFAEAFRLALFALELETGVWDDRWEPTITSRLTVAGFSPTALEVLIRNAGPTSELALVGWPRDRLGTVLALGVADVFGGMGSWNDQGFDDYEEYARVSGVLSESLRTTWEALLAPWGSHGLS